MVASTIRKLVAAFGKINGSIEASLLVIFACFCWYLFNADVQAFRFAFVMLGHLALNESSWRNVVLRQSERKERRIHPPQRSIKD